MSFKERAVISNKLPTSLNAFAVPFTFTAKNGSFNDADKGVGFRVADEVTEVQFGSPIILTALAVLYISSHDVSVDFKVIGEGYETERIFFINKHNNMWAILRTDIPKPVQSIQMAFQQDIFIKRVVPLVSFEERRPNEYFSISSECSSIFSERLVVPNLRSGRMMKIPINLTLLKARIPALIDYLEQYGDSENEFLCKSLCELALVHPLGPERLIDYICTGDIKRFKRFLFLLSPSDEEEDVNNGSTNDNENQKENIGNITPMSPRSMSPSGLDSTTGFGTKDDELSSKKEDNEEENLKDINIMQLPKEYLRVDDDVNSVIKLKKEPIYIKNTETGKYELSVKNENNQHNMFVKLLDIRDSVSEILQQLKISKDSFDRYLERQKEEIYLPLITVGVSKFVCISEIISDIYYISLAEIIVENSDENGINNNQILNENPYRYSEFFPNKSIPKGFIKQLKRNTCFGPNDIGWFSDDNRIFGKLLNGELFDPEIFNTDDGEIEYQFYPRNFMFVVLLLKFYYNNCLSYVENGICSKPRCMMLLLDDLLESIPENIWGRKEFIDVVSNNLSPDSLDIAKYSEKFLDCVVNEYADIYTLNVIAPYIIRDMIELRNEKKKSDPEYDSSGIKAGFWVRLKSCLTNRETRLLMTPNLKTDGGSETNAINDRLVGIYFEKLNKELGTKKPCFGWQGLNQRNRQTIGRVVYYNELLDIGVMQIEGNSSFKFRRQDLLVIGNGKIKQATEKNTSGTKRGDKTVQILNYFSNIFDVPSNPLNIGPDEKYEGIIEGNMEIKSNYPQILQTRSKIMTNIYEDIKAISNDLFMWSIKYKGIEQNDLQSELWFATIIDSEVTRGNDLNLGNKLQSIQSLSYDLKNKIGVNDETTSRTRKKSTSSLSCYCLNQNELVTSSDNISKYFENLLTQKNIVYEAKGGSRSYHLNIKMKNHNRIIRRGGLKELKKYMDVDNIETDCFRPILQDIVDSGSGAESPVKEDTVISTFSTALRSLLPAQPCSK